jgi:uncharacterized membrane protein YdjX (TVP38/TMEM64 family)
MKIPRRPVSAILDFVNNMDARAQRAVAVTVGMFVVVAAILVVGRLMYGDQVEATMRAWLDDAERAHWGLPAAMVAFTLAALIGAPQFVLIAACVVAFGPEKGFWYAWAATIVSGVVTFFMGRFAGADTMKRFSGATGGRFTRFMGQNAFMTSFVVRMLPTAPFIIVNMAMGAARMNFLPFLAGMTLGVLPKTAIIAFAGDGIMDALEGNVGAAALAGAIAIAVWFGVVVFSRRFIRRTGEAGEKNPPPAQ